MANWGIVGHKRALNLLSRALQSGRAGHAYLFTGAPAIGKTTLALAFAKAVNCTSNPSPCNSCRNCRLIGKRAHPDVRVIEATNGPPAGESPAHRESAKKHAIGIDQIREMQREAALLPYEANKKVYIIRNAENMTTEAANSLLKTLEEPPPSVMLILTCSDAKILPATVSSRCQQINLWPLSAQEVKAALLAQADIAEEDATILAHLSNGRIGWALEIAGNRAALSERESTLQRIVDLASATRMQRFGYAEEVAALFGKDQEAAYAVLDLWLSWWRDILLVKNNCSDLVTNINMISRLSEQAIRYTVEQIRDFIIAIENARTNLEQNVNARLALEVMMLNVPQASN